ncbi:MAG: PPC domain-containing protein [Planctomycetota bacterium]
MSATVSHIRPARTLLRFLTLAVVPFVAALTGVDAANGASPTLGAVNPWGGQRGTEMEIFLGGDRLSDAQQILFYKPGIEVLGLEVVNNNQVKAKIKIAPDCSLGEHPLRLRTATGISELRVFQVGMFPALAETEPNNEFAKPQAIPINTTVAGTVENEDVDYFVVEAKKGDRISAEVEAIRLGITLFDVYVAILDEKRFELAANDDTALLLQDTFASVIAPADGKYVVQVRESAYGGNGSCQYRLHVGNFPRPSAVYPSGGKVGEELTLKFLGDVAGEATQTVKLPEAPKSDFSLFLDQNGLSSPSPNPFRVTDLTNLLEAEPNNEFSNATLAPIPLPLACNGIISEKGDIDCFKVKAGAGQVFEIHVYARRLRSALDAVLTVHDINGNAIVGNDDAFGPDSYLRFQAPADGEYFIRVTDHLGKGGSDYVYRVETQPVAASLTLSIPQVAQSSQERQTVPVPRGNRYATLIQGNRVNFGGELVIGADGLPEKVTVQAENMADNLGLVPVVFEAAPDAPVVGKLVDLFATHADPNQKIRGSLLQKVDLVTGPPNITVYYQTSVDRLAVAVTDEAPFKISVVEPKVPLVQNGSMELKVIAERKEGYNAPIALYFSLPAPRWARHRRHHPRGSDRSTLPDQRQ